MSRKCQNMRDVKNTLKGKKMAVFSVKYLVLLLKKKKCGLNFQTSATGIKPEGNLRLNQALDSLT